MIENPGGGVKRSPSIARDAATITWAGMADLTPAEWNGALAGGGLPWSYEYVATRGNLSAEDPEVLVVRDAHGALSAAMPTRSEKNPLSQIYDPFANALTPALDITAEEQAPWLSVGPPCIYMDTLFPGRGGNDADGRLRDLLWTQLHDRAERIGATMITAMYLDGDGARLLRRDHGAIVLLIGLTGEIDTRGLGGLDDYLRTLPRKRRTAVRREIGRIADSGLTVRSLTSSDVDFGRLAELYARNLDRHGDPDAVRTAGAFMHRHASLLADHVRVWTCSAADDIVGFSLACEFGGRLWVRAVGFDYERLTHQDLYFTLGYYLPLQYAIEHRLDRVDLGLGALEAKKLRGARLTPRWCAASFLGDEPRHAAERAQRWNAARLGEYTDRFGAAVRHHEQDHDDAVRP